MDKRNMKNFTKTPVIMLALASALILLAACATMGSPFRFAGAESVEVGKTSKSEVLSLYGKPFRVGVENGDATWTYGYYRYKLFGDSQTKDLKITFDKKGIVSDYNYSSSEPDEVDTALKE